MNFKETLNQLLNENAPPMMRGIRPRQAPGFGYSPRLSQRPPMGVRQGSFAGAPEEMFRRPTPPMPQRQSIGMPPKPYADPTTQAAPVQPEIQPSSRVGPMAPQMAPQMQPQMQPSSRAQMLTTPMSIPTTPGQMPFDMPQDQPLEFGGQPSLPEVPVTPEVQMQPPQSERMTAPRMPTSGQMMGGPSSQPVSTPDMLGALEPSMFANFMTNRMKSPAPTQQPQPQPQPQPQSQGTGMGMGMGMPKIGMPRMSMPAQAPSMPTPEISQGQVMDPEYVPSELRMGDSGEFDYATPSQYTMSRNRYRSPEEQERMRRKAYFRESIESSLKKK